MAADPLPVMSGVLVDQRRSLAAWGVALAAVTAMYASFYPSLGGTYSEDLVKNLPEGLVTALGYDELGTAGGWLTTTVYGLLAPALLLVFAISAGARLLAGQEEDGSLELELTSPVSRRRLMAERLGALCVALAVLVGVVAVVTLVFVALLGMDVGVDRVLAGATGLYLLVVGFGTVALAVGAATGRRAIALGVAAGLAVGSFMLNAIGPAVGVDWMTAVSPFSWYLEHDPLVDGFDVGGLVLLAAVPVVAALGGLAAYDRRDLMV